MSGTFKDMNVPPTLVAFALAPVDVSKIISSEFKKVGSQVVLLQITRDAEEMPNFEALDKSYSLVHKGIDNGIIIAAHTVRIGGIAEAVAKMSFGNRIGMQFNTEVSSDELFISDIGSIVLEIDSTDKLQ